MPIRLKWKNPNTGNTVVRIYRSATPIDPLLPPAPIVEIVDNSTSYLDAFPKYGETFYYMFSVLVGGRELFSTNRIYSCLIDLGPGPKDLVLGDFKLGYFGTVTTGDLGFGSSLYGAGVSFNTLYKLVRNGKIIYSPLVSIITTVNALVASKVLTSGITSRNDPYAGSGGMIRDFNGRLFALRVSKFWDDTNTDVTFANYQIVASNNFPANVVTPTGKSEYVDIARLSRASQFDIPARFSFGSDSTAFSTPTTALGSSDFASATTIHSTYSINNLLASTSALTTAINFHPVIEYKGTV